jgi:hypothetical protein
VLGAISNQQTGGTASITAWGMLSAMSETRIAGLAWTAGIVGTVAIAFLTVHFGIVPLAAVVALILAAYFSSRPKAGFAVWVAGTASIPIWAGLDTVTFIAPATAITVVLLPLLIRHGRWRIGWVDAAIALMVFFCILGMLYSTVSLSSISIVLLQWLPAFVVGRALAPAVGADFVNRCMAAVFAVVGAWSVIEFLFGMHLFVDFQGLSGQRVSWAPLQERGGVIRSEAAFGHAIALGAALAAAIPFTIAARIRIGPKLIALSLIAAGVVCTFSRGPLLAAGLTTLLTLLFARKFVTARLRRGFTLLVVLAGAALVPALIDFFGSAGRELGDGTQYRERLFASFFEDLNLVGTANGMATDTGGNMFYRQFRSIDSALIVTGITYGTIVLVIVLLLIAACAIALLRGRATPARIAVVGQIPVLATVALITQYAEVAWFLAGIAAVSSALEARGQPSAQAEELSQRPSSRALQN